MLDLEAKVWKGVFMIKKVEESKKKITEQLEGLVKTEQELIAKLNEVRELKSRCLGALELIDNLEKEDEDDGVDTESDK